MEEEKIDGARSPEKQHIRPLLFLYVSYKKVKMGVSEDVRGRKEKIVGDWEFLTNSFNLLLK